MGTGSAARRCSAPGQSRFAAFRKFPHSIGVELLRVRLLFVAPAALQQDATKASEAQPFTYFNGLQTMKNLCVAFALYATSGAIALMGVQSLAEHPIQHSGTQQAVRVAQW